MADTEYIVEMRHITKRFPGLVANDDVSIQIKKGEIYAILGENGAGKSTLMSMLFGMYEPDEGEIYIRGNREVIDSPRRATQLNIGMVHQHFKLVSNYTVAENIILGMEPMTRKLGLLPWVDVRRANQEIEALSQRYGLKVNPTDVIEDLTVSAQQRVEILKMLYREAEILIFDEPTAVLTPPGDRVSAGYHPQAPGRGQDGDHHHPQAGGDQGRGRPLRHPQPGKTHRHPGRGYHLHQ